MSAARPRPPRADPERRARVRTDTIVACATAAGRGAVAVIRLSGPRTEEIGRLVVRPWPSAPRTLERCAIHAAGPQGQLIDDGLAALFPAPRSYTGETVLEVHTHGGAYVPGAVTAAFVAAGARPAEPGEFTERAVLNGKLDVIRAEAIGELIEARTGAMHRSALHALSGARSREFAALRAQAIALEALLAYDIDFPEEDDGPVSRERIAAAAMALCRQLEALQDDARRATVARDGAMIVLAGAPNAGKSSLLNALAGESRVIVSDEPGTTRDAVEVLLDADPIPMRLVDTAGIRVATGTVERLGIEVSERYLRGADVILLCGEGDGPADEVRERVAALTSGVIVGVRTKADLASPDSAVQPDGPDVRVSALTGDGLPELRHRIMREITTITGLGDRHTGVVASARQRAAITTALTATRAFLDAWRSRALPVPVAASHLREATAALDSLIGVVDVDDILEQVFSTFCVGK